MPLPAIPVLLFCIILSTTMASAGHHRHLLHQPFFPLITPTPSPSPSFLPHPKSFPFSAGTTSPSSPHHPNSFFPSSSASSSPPPPSPTTLATFPANISFLLFPPKSSHPHHVVKVSALVSSVLSAAFLISLLAVFIIFFRRRSSKRSLPVADDGKSSRSDSHRLFNAAPSDGTRHHTHPPKYTSSNSSSEFLYLGTLAVPQNAAVSSSTAFGIVGSSLTGSASTSQYQKLGSPELRPLPQLPKHNAFTPTYRSEEQLNQRDGELKDDVEDNDEFFSPKGSSGVKESPTRVWSSSRRELQGIGVDHFGSTSFNSRTASYPYSNSCSPTGSISSTSPSSGTNPSSKSLKSKSPPANRSPTSFFSPPVRDTSVFLNSFDRISGSVGQSKQYLPVKPPPPPPPPPPPRFWEASTELKTSPEKNSSETTATSGEKSSEGTKKGEETPKPKLKPLHWDKVRASPSRVMVWDQIKSSSFQLNEEMIETLFRVNDPNPASRDQARRQGVQCPNQENRVLDPKKSQNIAILLRALNVTMDEVCEALLEGNCDTLGAELLECLLKMAPTHEEEQKLKEFKDESSFKLGPGEKFLKAVLDIPFPFKRVDAMLYVVNFDSETEHLRRSLDTLVAAFLTSVIENAELLATYIKHLAYLAVEKKKSNGTVVTEAEFSNSSLLHAFQFACDELRNTRMFLKLLEAVLKIGNQMNVGTNRGDAQAFKLDTLLKLVDVKGMDGKTTLLHFVVQEIIKCEGSRIAEATRNPKNENAGQSSLQDEIEHRKLGLQVVSGLSSELMNVKKAAAMDSNALNNDIKKLATGITKVKEVMELNQYRSKFYDSISAFLSKAQEEVNNILARGDSAFSMVKEVTEYFHGNLAKEETHPFRIFVVVRDFLSILDQVCKEVAKVNDRAMYGSARPSTGNPSTLPVVFSGFHGLQLPRSDSSDDEILPTL